jgi:hypothetical protein
MISLWSSGVIIEGLLYSSHFQRNCAISRAIAIPFVHREGSPDSMLPNPR